MKVINKSFTQDHLGICEQIKRKSQEEYGLSPVNNICLITQKINELSLLDGDYVECGTFKGNTLIPAALYSKSMKPPLRKKLWGIDTFKGFPPHEHHEKDLPSYFIELHSQTLISDEHFELAKKRTNNFEDISHLENEYFLEIKEIFNICEEFEDVGLLQGTFEEITPQFDRPIAILHLDGDLYEGYLTCLNNLYDNIIEGGCVIFDEYYSHKYPGARAAVNEFFIDKTGYFEKYITEERHERWCFTKEK